MIRINLSGSEKPQTGVLVQAPRRTVGIWLLLGALSILLALLAFHIIQPFLRPPTEERSGDGLPEGTVAAAFPAALRVGETIPQASGQSTTGHIQIPGRWYPL